MAGKADNVAAGAAGVDRPVAQAERTRPAEAAMNPLRESPP
jgi:hypothetical protein